MSLKEKKRLDTDDRDTTCANAEDIAIVLTIERSSQFGIMSAERYMLSTVNNNIS